MCAFLRKAVCALCDVDRVGLIVARRISSLQRGHLTVSAPRPASCFSNCILQFSAASVGANDTKQARYTQYAYTFARMCCNDSKRF